MKKLEREYGFVLLSVVLSSLIAIVGNMMVGTLLRIVPDTTVYNYIYFIASAAGFFILIERANNELKKYLPAKYTEGV